MGGWLHCASGLKWQQSVGSYVRNRPKMRLVLLSPVLLRWLLACIAGVRHDFARRAADNLAG
eukprot:COSAG01_NODE_20534_length_949_cov_0.536471_1_plen_61_part_10